MCTRAFVKKGDQFNEASTRGELWAALGVEPVYEPVHEPHDDDCLCCCDLEATAALAGHTLKDADFGDVEFWPNDRGEA